MQKKIRYSFIDNMKFAACILVALSHFFMSVTAAKIMPYSIEYFYFVKTLYTFLVPIFFVCSGFLYQNSFKITSINAYKKELPKKLLDLGVPYFVFSTVTLLLKFFFESDVNTKPTEFWDTLLIHPTAPYWFLYSLFLMFLFIPCMKSKRGMAILFSLSFILKIVNVLLLDANLIQGVMYSENVFIRFTVSVFSTFSELSVWFCLGMALRFFDLDKLKKAAKPAAPVLLILALAVSYPIFVRTYFYSQKAVFLIGFMFIVFTVFSALIITPEPLNRLSFKFSEYFIPVFVLHTIFSAGIRIILIKFGITSLAAHILGGLVGSFVLPAAVYMLCRKITPLMFFFYPTKTIKLLKGKKHE